MRYKLLGALVFISCAVQAQQVNPVPDYVFQNRMSVGRTTVTDTLAYFSMGPRYGAIRGFMPPMVVDTALVTGGTKRNGLTIFSIQKNKYVYWDSVGSKWAEMAGTGGSAINSGDTASMLSPYTRGSGTTNYVPKFTGTRTFGNSQIFDNGINIGINTNTPKPYNVNSRALNFLSSTANTEIRLTNSTTGNDSTVGLLLSQYGVNAFTWNGSNGYLVFGTNNLERVRIKSDGEFLVNTNTDAGSYSFQVAGSIYNTTSAILAASSGNVGIGIVPNSWSAGGGSNRALQIGASNVYYDAGGNTGTNLTHGAYYDGTNWKYQLSSVSASRYELTGANAGSTHRWSVSAGGTAEGTITFTEAMRINSSSELLINTTTDAGAYALQVAGSIYNTTGAVFAASSGNVGIGTTTTSQKLDIRGAEDIKINLESTLTGTNANSGLLLKTTSDGSWLIQTGYAAGNGLRFSDNVAGAERMRIDNTGNMGIGTTAPAERLHLSKTGDIKILVETTSSGSGANAALFMKTATEGHWAIQTGNAVSSGLRFYDLTAGAERARFNSSGEFLILTSTDAGAYALQVAGAIYNTTTLTTGAPTSGTAKPWRLGEAATVSPTSPNRTIRVEIDGTVYYIHAKTTND